MTRPLRREDRRMDRATAMALLKCGEYGILSTADNHHQPYGTPLNYVLMKDHIFFHCAPRGHKLENIAANPAVSFCVVGKTELIPEKFSTCYESVIVSGEAEIVANATLKKDALRALVRKYAPDQVAAGEAYIDRLEDKTAVVQITIQHLSGKARLHG
ncbi:pyridoxamine 5'-phosphate oxidase family protein [Desulfosarcina ovata]|uniref:MFS transporter n=1 Tax=Desulfosarcina ovata subsp. ovata TaxID=2752305 RepID=A0A5K8AG36_9BACT|nr:pyridoxamine 5'-phosphate oxidase family protein [Desulfosarcina ovata]BBO91469.1 MFS transporter [Desulfosarcina ovata subsp. ovata]